MKQSIKELLFSAVAFIFSYSIAYLTGIELVKNAVLLAFIIQWILYIPAYLLQTEKFYDISGETKNLAPKEQPPRKLSGKLDR